MSSALLEMPRVDLPPPVAPPDLGKSPTSPALTAEQWAPPTGEPFYREFPLKSQNIPSYAELKRLRAGIVEIDADSPSSQDAKPASHTASPEQRAESRMHRLGYKIGRMLNRRSLPEQTDYLAAQPQQLSELDISLAKEKIKNVAESLQSAQAQEVQIKDRVARLEKRLLTPK